MLKFIEVLALDDGIDAIERHENSIAEVFIILNIVNDKSIVL